MKYLSQENKQTRKELRKKIKDPKYRINMYNYLLKQVYINKYDNWLCGLCLCFPSEFNVFATNYVIKLFPELIALKPARNHSGNWWFSPRDYDSRINLLNEAIEAATNVINFDAAQPRIAEVHTIMRDKKKPYTVYSHCSIITGDSMNGIDDRELKEDMTFGSLGDGRTSLRLTKEEARVLLVKIKDNPNEYQC